MAELAAIGLASNILQFVEIGYKLTRRVLEFADTANEVPKSIRHLYDRLPLILHVLNHISKWSEDEPLDSRTNASLLPIIVESRDCARELFDILDNIRPRPASKTFTKALKAVKSIAAEDAIQRLVASLDHNVSLLNAYQNAINAEAVQNLVKDTSEGFGSLNDNVTMGFDKVLREMQKASLLDWVAQDPSSEYHELHETVRVANTCGWIWDRQPVLEWQNSLSASLGGKYLWIHGSSGMGKTFLAARIVEDLAKVDDVVVFAYFCRHDTTGHSSNQIVRSLLSRMIITDDTDITLELVQPFFKIRKSRIASHGELWSMFQAIVSKVNSYVFVIDGLDEYIRTEIDSLSDTSLAPSKTLVPSFLESLVQATTSAGCHVLLVSRDQREIRSILGRAHSSRTINLIEYGIRESDLQADALLLAQHIVESKLPKHDPALREELAQSIARKSAGQMLWVRLQEQALKSSYKDKKLRQLVQNMPVGVRDTYDTQVLTMLKLPSAERDRALRLLRWILFARDPVTVHLLIEAMLIDTAFPLDTFPDDDLPRDINDEDVSDEIKQLCHFVDFQRTGLEQEQCHWVVAFPHASRKEFLLSINDDYHVPELRAIRFADRALQESIMTRTCLHFLGLENVWTSPETESTIWEEVVAHRPFLRYAILNWPHHATYGMSEEVCRTAVIEFCANDNTVWNQWRDGFEKLTEESDQRSKSKTEPGSRLYYACEFGHIELISQLLEEGESPTVPCGRRGSPLHAAIAHENTEIIRLLLRYACDLAVRNLEGETVVHSMITSASKTRKAGLSATQRDSLSDTSLRRPSSFQPMPDERKEIVTMLLDGGADLAAIDDGGWTAVNRAAAEGFLEVVELLIRQGADVNTPDHSGGTPVRWAASGGHKEVIALLVQHGANFLKGDNGGWTPIDTAALRGHFEVVELLIKCGADVSEPNHDGWTPVNSAAAGGYREVIELLIRNGANIKTPEKRGGTPLHTAAQLGHRDVAELLIQHGMSLETPDLSDRTPIFRAAAGGHTQVADLLIHHGADFRRVSNDGMTPVHTAAIRGHKQVVTLLVQHGADVKTPSRDWAPIFAAAGNGYKDIVEILIQHGADITVADSKGGMTPLHIAALRGHRDVAKLLLQYGADVNVMSDTGSTPVHHAARRGRKETVELLIQHGADITLANSTNGATPLYEAAMQGHYDVVQILIQHGGDVNFERNDGRTPINIAAQKGRKEVVELLIQHGADFKAANTVSKWMPLHEAAASGHSDVVDILTQNGADIDAIDEDGYTPVHMAALSCHVEVVKVLMQNGADVNLANKDNRTPLNSAANNGHAEIVDLLIQNGADTEIADARNGGTPLFHAAGRDRKAVVALLIRHGADINVGNRFNWTPLHSAVYGGHVGSVEVLLQHKADISKASRTGATPLCAAVFQNHKAIVELLLQHGGKINEPDGQGETPLYIAARSDQGEVLQCLIDRGADVDIHVGYYTSSLHAALSCGSGQIVEALINKGSVLRPVDFRSVGSALAASLGRFSSGKIHLFLGLIENEKWYPEALQELLCFATESNLGSEICQKLIDAGASLQLPGVYGWTPAQCSSMCDRLRPNNELADKSTPLSILPAPKRWSPFDNENVLQLLDNDRGILVQDSARDVHMKRRVKVYADFFMPADRGTFYFEVTFLAVGLESIIGVGFSHWKCPIDGMPGWRPGSWGYHGDDGKKFAASGLGDDYGPTYGAGDTIGCGVDFLTRSAFFTKNGVHLGTAFTELTGRLLPTCGFGERGTKLKANFGDDSFVYKGPVSTTEPAIAT